MDSIGIETQSQTDSTKITILVEINSIGIEIMFLAGMNGSMVLIFSRESSIGWVAPSYAQFFNLVVASTMVTSSQ